MKVSICIPVYGMDNALEFLKRNLDSIKKQTFTDYEIIISDDSDNDLIQTWVQKYKVKYFKNPGTKGMAINTNYALDQAEGELVKILFQDDYFKDENSLADIVKHFTPSFNWLVTGCAHIQGYEWGQTFNDHMPYFSESENTIGSPSVLTFRNSVKMRFDPEFHWILDLDLYKRLFREYGLPKVLNKVNVVIGLGAHQVTNKLSDQRKQLEYQLLMQKYDTRMSAKL